MNTEMRDSSAGAHRLNLGRHAFIWLDHRLLFVLPLQQVWPNEHGHAKRQYNRPADKLQPHPPSHASYDVKA